MLNFTEKIDILEFTEVVNEVENNSDESEDVFEDSSLKEDVFSTTTEYKKVKTLSANILNMSNNEIIANYSKYANLIFSFRVYYNRFTRDLAFKTKDYRLRYRDQYFDIIAVQFKDRDFVDIKAKAVV